MEDQTLHSYVGGWPEYVRVREERAEAKRTAKRTKAPATVKAAPQARGGGARPRSKNEQARAKKLEAEIEKAEAALAALEAELADPGAWNDPRSAAKSTRAPQGREEDARGALRELGGRRELAAAGSGRQRGRA